jgi:hypothetical protein
MGEQASSCYWIMPALSGQPPHLALVINECLQLLLCHCQQTPLARARELASRDG